MILHASVDRPFCAIHNGWCVWYGALHLDPSLFLLDAATVFVMAHHAWIEGLSYMIVTAPAHVHRHVGIIALLVFLVAAMIVGVKYVRHHRGKAGVPKVAPVAP